MKQDKKSKEDRIRAKKKKVNEKLDKTSAYKKDKKNTVTGKKSNPKFEKLMDKETKLTDKLKKAKAKDPKLEQKSKQRVEKDYARNAIHDYETGHKSEANYEKKKELEVAAGEMHGYFASASKVHKHGKGRS